MAEQRASSISVLIIDDDAGFALVVERRVKAALGSSTQTTHASTLKEARQILQGKFFNLVILDQHLPDGRGVDLLSEGVLSGLAVLAMSSDDSSEMPASTIRAGAHFFLPKLQVGAPFFPPILNALLERVRLERDLATAQKNSTMVETVRTILATLQHEINNPLAVLLSATYLLKGNPSLSQEQKDALKLAEDSAKRISDVIKQLSDAVTLEKVTKGPAQVFQVPGDPKW